VGEQAAFSQDVRLMEEMFQILLLAIDKQLQMAVQTADLKRLQSEM
jgi:hypothetical protein